MHMRTNERAFDRISLIEGLLLRRVVIYAKLQSPPRVKTFEVNYLDAITSTNVFLERRGEACNTDCTVHVILIAFLI